MDCRVNHRVIPLGSARQRRIQCSDVGPGQAQLLYNRQSVLFVCAGTRFDEFDSYREVQTKDYKYRDRGTGSDKMSRPKRGDKKSKEATADREDETCFTDDRADTSRKTGHGKLPGATGGEGTSGSTEVVGTDEADQAKKKSGPFKRIRKSISKVASRSSKSSSKDVQSPTSPISLDDSLRQSEETEELPAKEV